MNEQSMGVQHGSELPKLKSVSDLFNNAWKQYQEHFKILVSIMLVAGVGLYLQTIFMFVFDRPPAVNGVYAILALLATLIYIAGMLWGFSALINTVRQLEKPTDVKQAYIDAKPYIWPLFVAGLFSALFTILGFVLLIIPGIIVSVWLSFVYFTTVIENKRGMEALKASKAYVEGYWWAVFGRILLVGLVIGLISAAVGGLAIMIMGDNLGTLVQNIISLAATPFVLLFQYDLYKNLRNIKSGSVAEVVAE